MTNRLSVKETKLMLLYVAQVIVNNEDYLTQIDEKIGDGDHGIGMTLGFNAVLSGLAESEVQSVEEVFQSVGKLLLDTMGGASGVLFGTLFISGTMKSEGHLWLTSSVLADIFRHSLEVLKKRGKAKVGDKTMIDALEPAVRELENNIKKPLKTSLSAAANASLLGVESSKPLLAKFGRAKFYGEAAIGYQDAGATSVALIFKGMSEWVEAIRENEM